MRTAIILSHTHVECTHRVRTAVTLSHTQIHTHMHEADAIVILYFTHSLYLSVFQQHTLTNEAKISLPAVTPRFFSRAFLLSHFLFLSLFVSFCLFSPFPPALLSPSFGLFRFLPRSLPLSHTHKHTHTLSTTRPRSDSFTHPPTHPHRWTKQRHG